MDPLKKFLNQVSYKFPKGYPDINNENDILLLKKLLKENMGVALEELNQNPAQLDLFPEDLDDKIKQLVSTLDDNETKKRIIKILTKANKKEDIYDEDEIKDLKTKILKILKDEKKLAPNYANAVYRISLDLGEYKQLFKYLNNPTITTLPENGNLKNLFSPTSLSEDFINELIELYGRSTGKGEIALIVFLKNCTARGGQKIEGKGDIYLNGSSIEIKQGDRFKLVPFDISEYGIKPSIYLEDKTKLEFKSGERWPNTLQNYWKEQKVSTEQINNIIKDFYINYVSKITDQQLQTPEGLLNHIADNLAEQYLTSKQIMLISANSPYEYVFKKINNINDYKELKNTSLKISAFSDKFPRFSYSPSNK